MTHSKTFERYFFFGLLSLALLFTFLLFRPFWVVLVLGLSFSILLSPVYEWFKGGRLPNWLASLVTVLLFAVILCGPILGIGALVFNQSQDLYYSVVANNKADIFLSDIDNAVNKILPAGITFDAQQKVADIISVVTNNITDIFRTTVSAFFSFILMLLTIFYLLKDGAKWRKTLIVLSPLSEKDDEKIISKLTMSVNWVIRGYLFIALVQGTLLGFGFYIFGIHNPALWGVVAAFASMVPTVGTALVSVPAIIFLLSTGHIGAAVGLLIWEVVLVSTIDNFLSPYVVGRKINIPPLFILFSVLGGISILGPMGVLVGPLTLSFLYSLISIYRNEFKQAEIF